MLNSNFVNQVVELTNQERARFGLAPLRFNAQLQSSAQTHSQNMAGQDFFSHTGKDGSSATARIQATGYIGDAAAWRTGENIAAGQSTPQTVVQGWMNSPGHKANILNPDLLEIGVGYFFMQSDTGAVNYNHYWTQNFGTRRGSTSADRGTNNNDSLTGGANNNSLWGFGGNDVLKGEAGDDFINGGTGSDTLLGGAGSDRLVGDAGNDILDGFLTSSPNGNQQDFLQGGGDADRFILGSTTQVYYKGLGFAVVEDFNLSQGDRIQLKGQATDYILAQENRYVGTGSLETVIYHVSNPADPIGVVQDVAINNSAFVFV